MSRMGNVRLEVVAVDPSCPKTNLDWDWKAEQHTFINNDTPTSLRTALGIVHIEYGKFVEEYTYI